MMQYIHFMDLADAAKIDAFNGPTSIILIDKISNFNQAQLDKVNEILNTEGKTFRTISVSRI